MWRNEKGGQPLSHKETLKTMDFKGFRNMFTAVVDRLLPRNSKRRLFVYMIYLSAQQPVVAIKQINISNIKMLFRLLAIMPPSVLESEMHNKLLQESIRTAAS